MTVADACAELATLAPIAKLVVPGEATGVRPLSPKAPGHGESPAQVRTWGGMASLRVPPNRLPEPRHLFRLLGEVLT